LAVNLTFGNFSLRPVLGCIASEEAAEVRDMWVGERVLDRQEASRRTSEVVFLIRERSSGVLAGVCTVYPGPLGETGLIYWHFRMFMRRSFRGVSGLPRFVLFASYRHLQEHIPAGCESVRGILIVPENPAFRRHRFREHFAKQNPPWTFFGADKKGYDVFYRDFETT
jgi:hypothetical protein